MSREDLREELYQQTGTWFSNEELDEYLNCYSSNEEKKHYTSSSFQFDIDDENNDLLNGNVVEEVNSIFLGIVQKAKISIENRNIIPRLEEHLDELSYFGKIFLCKCFLYYILQKGNEKGYTWKGL